MSGNVGQKQRTDACLLAGLVLLLVASTMNGLTFEARVAGLSVTIRPDQVVLVMLMPLLAVALVRGRLRCHSTPGCASRILAGTYAAAAKVWL